MHRKFIRSIKQRGILRTTQIAIERSNPWSSRSLEAKQRSKSLASLRAIAQEDGCVIKRIHGSLMRLDVSPGTKHTLETDLAIEETRESTSTDFYREKLVALKASWENANRPVPLILDIGANVGYFVLLEGLIFGGKATIVAIEPEADNCERLAHNIALNHYSCIKVIRAAVSSESGKATLHVGNQSNIHKLTLEGTDPNFADIQHVDVMTIDELVREHADNKTPLIIRMDVEGHEWEAIKGMVETLRGDRPIYMFFELHQSALMHAIEIAKSLREAGFEVERIDDSKGWAGTPIPTGFDSISTLKTDAHIFAKRSC
jgi:FkbM family methyltransferase